MNRSRSILRSFAHTASACKRVISTTSRCMLPIQNGAATATPRISSVALFSSRSRSRSSSNNNVQRMRINNNTPISITGVLLIPQQQQSRCLSSLRSSSFVSSRAPLLSNNKIISATSTPALQRRCLFVASEDTPNPNSMKFYPTGEKVLEKGATFSFDSPLDSYCSPLAKMLFKIDGVRSLFFSSDFITVTKTDDREWSEMQLEIYEAISNFYALDLPVIDKSATQASDTAPQEDDDEVVISIKEILETRIRPMVQEDGGDIFFHGFENGVVFLKLQGACSTCPSSTATLKNGIENMLMHYIPEVQEVRAVEDEALEKVSQEQLRKVEEQQQQQQ